MQDHPLIIGSRSFQSRLLVGTGKYKDLQETDLAIQASGAEIVTLAIRRVNIGQDPSQPNLLIAGWLVLAWNAYKYAR